VRLAAKRFNYKPSQHAKSFREANSNAVGIIFWQLTDPFYAEILETLSCELSKIGISSMVTVPRQSAKSGFKDACAEYLNWRIKQIILMPPPFKIDRKEINHFKSQCVIMSLDHYDPIPDLSAVYSDRKKMVELGVKYLIDKGHHRIGVISYNPDFNFCKTLDIHNELQKYGLRLNPDDIFYSPIPSVSSDSDELTRIFFQGASFAGKKDRPSALISYSDMYANRFLSGFSMAGGKFQENLDIVSHNSSKVAATAAWPLPTVGVPVEKLVGATVKMIQEARAAMKRKSAYYKQEKLSPEISLPPNNIKKRDAQIFPREDSEGK
jgi:LacI family transcriptional regulator